MSSKSGQVIGLWWTKKKILNADDFGAEPGDVEVINKQDLVRQLRYSILSMKADHTDPSGTKVNYADIKDSPKFTKYKALVRNLRQINLESMTSPEERKSFLINIYNSLVIHALIEGMLNGSLGGTLNRLQLYATASYVIGGTVFSLNEIENGLLRGNRLSAVPMTGLSFRDGDARAVLVLPCDPRIHFALNCGAMSCPPIAVYTPEYIDQELTDATVGFLDGNTEINVEGGYLKLSMLFKWYRQDFGNTDADVITWIKEHAAAEMQEKITLLLTKHPNPKLQYTDYNWTLNS